MATQLSSFKTCCLPFLRFSRFGYVMYVKRSARLIISKKISVNVKVACHNLKFCHRKSDSTYPLYILARVSAYPAASIFQWFYADSIELVPQTPLKHRHVKSRFFWHNRTRRLLWKKSCFTESQKC